MRMWLLLPIGLLAACGDTAADGEIGASSRPLTLCVEAEPGGDELSRIYEACKAGGRLMVATEVGLRCMDRASTREECEARGGEWLQDMADLGTCFEPTSDAGKPCCDLDDCEGFCSAPEGARDYAPTQGSCSPYTGALCGNWVSNGLASGTWCL